MTEITMKPKKMTKIPLGQKKWPHDLETYKLTEMTLKPKKWLKWPCNLKSDRKLMGTNMTNNMVKKIINE